METPKGHDRKFLVCFYEFLGTALFQYIALLSGATGSDIWGIAGPLALFVVVNIFGGITGGHFNPAVTAGVYVREANYGGNLLFAILIMASQIGGALIGMLMVALVARVQVNGEYTIPATSVPLLLPSPVAAQVASGGGDVDKDEIFTTMYMQIVCTFLFVVLILFLTGKKTMAPDLGQWGLPAIILNLWALCQVDTFTAPSFNPALAIGQTTFQCWWYPTNPDGVLLFYLPWYIIGAWLGGILAGVFYLILSSCFPDKEEEEKNLGKQVSINDEYQ